MKTLCDVHASIRHVPTNTRFLSFPRKHVVSAG